MDYNFCLVYVSRAIQKFNDYNDLVIIIGLESDHFYQRFLIPFLKSVSWISSFYFWISFVSI